MASKTQPEPPPVRVIPVRTRNEPPAYLSDAMKAWWIGVLEGFDLDQHHLHLLEAACTSWDRMTEARTAIAEHGLTFTDDRGTPKARPEVAIERDSRIAFARLVRELDLDDAPPPEPRGRPPGIRSNRR
jgi:P27 family predicted phage terminase small subunit